MPGRGQECDRLRGHSTFFNHPSMQPLHSTVRNRQLMDLLRYRQRTQLSTDIFEYDLCSTKRQRLECDRYRILRHSVGISSPQLDTRTVLLWRHLRSTHIILQDIAALDVSANHLSRITFWTLEGKTLTELCNFSYPQTTYRGPGPTADTLSQQTFFFASCN
jgi:hypothetical protein